MGERELRLERHNMMKMTATVTIGDSDYNVKNMSDEVLHGTLI